MNSKLQNFFSNLFNSLWERKKAFTSVFFMVMAVSYGFLVIIDFVPEAPAEETVLEVEVKTETDEINAEGDFEMVADRGDLPKSAQPERIIFDKLGTDVAIFNPNTLDIDALDQVLLNGVVRHPLSADFVNIGNILIFGHSSYLPHVVNNNFQAFNGVQDLVWGDRIRLQSADWEYHYRIDRIYQAKASEDAVTNQRGTATLTIVTCNSFATTDDRYIIEATLIGEVYWPTNQLSFGS